MLRLNMCLSVMIDDTYSDTQSWINLFNTIHWIKIISSSTWFNLLSCSHWWSLIKTYSLTQSNCFELTQLLWLGCYYLQLFMEGGERRSQSHSGEYYWLGSDLIQNKGGWYIPIFPVFLITITRISPQGGLSQT